MVFVQYYAIIDDNFVRFILHPFQPDGKIQNNWGLPLIVHH